MAADRRVYDSRHLQADCQEPGSATERCALNRVWATFTFCCWFRAVVMTHCCDVVAVCLSCRFQDDTEARVWPFCLWSPVGDHGSQRCRQVFTDEHPRWLQVSAPACLLSVCYYVTLVSIKELMVNSTLSSTHLPVRVECVNFAM